MRNEKLIEELKLRRKGLLAQVKAFDETIKALESEGEEIGAVIKLAKNQPTLREMISAALESVPVRFSLNDVARSIEVQFPAAQVTKDSLAAMFWKVAKEQNLKLVEKGAARKPAIYEKTS